MTEIAKEYSSALFMLACEEGKAKEYAASLAEVKEVFLENPGYLELLSSPAMPKEERLSVLEATFGGNIPQRVLSYLKLLCEKGRISFFLESVEEYKRLLSAWESVFHAKVTSAVELTEEEKEKLICKLESVRKGKVQAEYFVDPALLGGLIVEIDGNILDGSLRHRLYEVKEVMNL